VGGCLASSGLKSSGLTFVLPHLVLSDTSCEEGERNGEEGMRDGKMRDIGRCTNMSIMS
jgi:hypothetical protein